LGGIVVVAGCMAGPLARGAGSPTTQTWILDTGVIHTKSSHQSSSSHVTQTRCPTVGSKRFRRALELTATKSVVECEFI
jgi:hypothetical protein